MQKTPFFDRNFSDFGVTLGVLLHDNTVGEAFSPRITTPIGEIRHSDCVAHLILIR